MVIVRPRESEQSIHTSQILRNDLTMKTRQTGEGIFADSFSPWFDNY